MPPVRDPRVAERPGEDGVEVAREHLEGARRNRFSGREEMVGAPGKRGFPAALAGPEDLQRLARRLDADPVAGHDRDPHPDPSPYASSERSAASSSPPSG